MSAARSTPYGGAVAVTSRFWALATVGTLFLIGSLPLLWNRRYFFFGDTQIAYTGWWYHLGEQVLAGHLPLLDPLAWESGNLVAEGQWGLFSPLVIAIGIAAHAAPDLVVFATLLKLVLLAVTGSGIYLLIRSYRVSAPAAYVGGVLAPLCGQSIIYEWPSWVNGQMAVALLPWAWWLTRLAMRGANPLPALALCYLVVTIGYVYAALYLAIVLLGCLVDGLVARSRQQFLRALAIGVFSGLVVITVYLPGILTAPVTIRSGWDIVWEGRRTVDALQLGTSMIPTTNEFYLLSCLPILLWVRPSRLRSALSGLTGATVATAVLLAWVLGPAAIGPLRWPSRVLPALMVALVVFGVVVVSRAVRLPPRPGALLLSLAWVLVATVVVGARGGVGFGATVAGGLTVAVGLVLVGRAGRRGVGAAALALGLWSIAIFTVQHSFSPGVPSNDRNMPAAAADYRSQIAAAQGGVLVLGSYGNQLIIQRPGIAQDLLVGASWRLHPAAVQNGYSTISYRAFEDRFCMTFNGLTCGRALKAVLEREPTTGRRWVDLLSISTLVMFRPDFPEAEDPPSGWRVADRSEWTLTWVRDEPVPTAGGVVWSSDGVQVTQVAADSRSVALQVDDVPAGGGRVVLSRLNWPGYEVSGAITAAPLAGLLVTIDLPASTAGRSVMVHWSPPGWPLEVSAWWLAIVGGAAWSAVYRLRGRRPGSGGSVGGSENDAAVEEPPGARGQRKADHVGRDVVSQSGPQPQHVPGDR